MKPLIIVFSLSSVPKSVVLVYQSFKFVLHYKIKFLFGINILKLLLPICNTTITYLQYYYYLLQYYYYLLCCYTLILTERLLIGLLGSLK
ncbi:hypothetical protein ACQJ6U_03010 [Helicobacter pylori]